MMLRFTVHIEQSMKKLYFCVDALYEAEYLI